MIHERETEFRRRKFAQIREAMVAAAPVSQADGAAAPHRQALVDALDEFRSTLDLEAFRQKLDANSRGAGFSELFYGFNFGVAMFLNSLVKKSGEPSDLAALLIETIAVPANDQQADEKLASLLRQVELVREGGHPAPKSAAIFCSFFWWFQAPETWPFLGPASEEAVEALGWLPKDLDPVDRYRRYRTLIRSLSSDIAVGRPLSEVMVPASTETITLANVDAALTWFRDNQWIGLDNALGDRLQWAHELYEQRVDGEYPDDSFEVARTNIAAVLAEMRTLGDHSETAVGNALGRDLRRHVANEYWMKNPPIIRANAWVKWKPKNVTGWNEVCSMIVSATSDGIAIGVTPGRRQSGWSLSIRDELVALLPAGLQVVENYGDPFAVYAVEGAGQARRDFLVGTLIPMDQAVGSPDVAHEIERVAAALQPVFDRIMALAGSADEATAQSDATGEKPSDLGMTDEGAEPADEGAELEERLDSVVEECHLDGRSFVDDLVALLRDKRQIVLYGPPGTGKTVTVAAVGVLDGNSGNNYSVTYASNQTSAITSLAAATWTGSADTAWTNPANWVGGVVPDLSNVQTVTIPAGAGSVVFDASAGTTSLQSLTSARPISVTGGNLQIGTLLQTESYNQSGGLLSGAGAFNVSDSFVQTGGSIATPRVCSAFAQVPLPSIKLAPITRISTGKPRLAAQRAAAGIERPAGRLRPRRKPAARAAHPGSGSGRASGPLGGPDAQYRVRRYVPHRDRARLPTWMPVLSGRIRVPAAAPAQIPAE